MGEEAPPSSVEREVAFLLRARLQLTHQTLKGMFYDRVRGRVVCLHVAFREQGEKQQEGREHLRMWVRMTVAKVN